ncbi:MAG: arginase family protein [Chryseolinea sp.]
MKQDIQIISAPSILGLKPSGVELLGKNLIDVGLPYALNSLSSIIEVSVENIQYSKTRDEKTKCLNSTLIHDFSLKLADVVFTQVMERNFSLVLGGDCSILLGTMLALKRHGEYGLIFLDAHADNYMPDESPTGEVADMDLAIVTGRGPDLLTNIAGLKPYVKEGNVIHIGQRDAEETKRYGSRDIKDTSMQCFDFESLTTNGLSSTLQEVLAIISKTTHRGYWIHFDTDVLSDDENPAVDYRLPGGIRFKEIKEILHAVLQTGKVVGMSVTIFNPTLDHDGSIGRRISDCIVGAIKS